MKTNSLKKMPTKAKRSAVRFGRPPKELAGEVDARILNAARKVFLERGFEGASIDQIAEVARSGKRYQKAEVFQLFHGTPIHDPGTVEHLENIKEQQGLGSVPCSNGESTRRNMKQPWQV